MYLEKLKIDYGNLQKNIKKLEEDYKEHADNSLLVEIVHLKEDLIKLGYKIKRENLFNDYRNKKPISYHFIDSDDSEIDVMLDYGDVNYESAYKQNRNNLFADEVWDVMNFERENDKFFKPSLTVSSNNKKANEPTINNQSFSNKAFVKPKFLVFKKSNIIHIVSDAPLNYLKNNSNLIKKYLNDKNCKFILHNDKANEMVIDGIMVKIDSDGFVLKGDVDEYDSSEKVSVLSEDVKQKKDTNISNNVNKKSSNKTNSNKKEVNILELIGLMEKNDLSSVIKLISSCGGTLFWKSLDEGLEKGLISIHKFNFAIDYLKKYITPENPLYTEYFNKDFDNLIKKHSESKKVDSKDAAHIIPAKPVKRKRAKSSLIEKYKELSRGKKIAVVAGVIAAVGIGVFAAHMIPMIMDKINAGDTVNNASPENVKIVAQASKGIINNMVDKAQGSFQLVKDSIPHFNSVNAGDTVFRSASDSISGINGVSASGDFRDTVVAVFDNATQKVIRLTPDNIDSVRNLLDDPNVPKAFGDSFTPGNVSGWKTGSGYKTIFDVVKSVGGKSL